MTLVASLSTLDFQNEETVATLIRELDDAAKLLAKDPGERVNIGKGKELWDGLYRLWPRVAQRCLEASQPGQLDVELLCSTARFTRNLVAGTPTNQAAAFRVEPQIRSLIHYFTSFMMLQIPSVVSALHLLLQTLSNVITDNSELSSSLWRDYMAIPDDRNILIRSLSVDDVKMSTTCFVLMLNATRDNPDSCNLFVQSKAGQRVAVTLLNRVAVLIDAPEGSPEATACDIAYQFMKPIFDLGLAVTLFDAFRIEDEPMLPHQRILLKLLDGYFHNRTVKRSTEYAQGIPRLYASLTTDMLASIKRSLAAEPIVPESHLPALAEGVVLAAQCSQALLLQESEMPLDDRLTLRCMVKEVGSIELTVDTLKSLDILLPRLQFGKAVPSPMAKPHVDGDEGIDPAAFPYVKRDLLRLLGTLSYENKDVQDRMRACGGIEVVMNHCVVDESNPCTSISLGR
ncbi:hypothetical protein M408DRAFT_19203 [Serendipita vermifera MAFF 305830]|uniref:Ataxin-10 homolog n=1 Tax=Serendipita vermifera MAFF 305830 TaxID=933852 RepID=A0A0C3BSA7_SERVB|nr:hypothetical protein M408DRAFT_19203 [Serendipita vermifera MAFF 305830]